MDSRLSDEQSFLLYLAKYDRPQHLRDRQNPFEKFDDGQFIERFCMADHGDINSGSILTTTPTEQRMRRRSKTRIN